ncbi:MAG: hypothetical protein WC551_06040 [Patescibacteria group bacterium]
MSQHTAKIEILKSAVETVVECLRVGRVTNDALAPIGAAISLAPVPFIAMPSKRLVMDGVRAQPGTWPHYSRALINLEAHQLDLKKLREKGQAGDQTAERRADHFERVLKDLGRAFTAELERTQEMERAETNRQRAADEARRQRETEEARKAHEARKAARRALEEAAAANAEAPAERNPRPRNRRLTCDSIRRLLASETQKREQDGQTSSEAKLSAARFVISKPILTAAKDASYTDDEIALLKSEVKTFVQNVYFAESGKLPEAEREAANWLARAEGFARRQGNAPMQSAPAAAKTSVPSQDKRTEAKPANETGSGTIMGLALQKAGFGGKAANS